MKNTTIKLILLISLTTLLINCSSSNEAQIKNQLSALANELSYEKPISIIKTALKIKKIARFFSKEINISIKIKTASFNLRKSKEIQQHIFMLRKLVKNLNLKFNNIKIIKNKLGYLVQTTIYAIGKSKDNKPLDEFIDYEFQFIKTNDGFIISSGKNLKTI